MPVPIAPRVANHPIVYLTNEYLDALKLKRDACSQGRWVDAVRELGNHFDVQPVTGLWAPAFDILHPMCLTPFEYTDKEIQIDNERHKAIWSLVAHRVEGICLNGDEPSDALLATIFLEAYQERLKTDHHFRAILCATRNQALYPPYKTSWSKPLSLALHGIRRVYAGLLFDAKVRWRGYILFGRKKDVRLTIFIDAFKSHEKYGPLQETYFDRFPPVEGITSAKVKQEADGMLSVQLPLSEVSFQVFECLHDYENLLQSIHSHKDCVYNVAFEDCGGVEPHATIDLHDMPPDFEVGLHHLS